MCSYYLNMQRFSRHELSQYKLDAEKLIELSDCLADNGTIIAIEL